MAVWSIIPISTALECNRLDAEFFQPEFLKVARQLQQVGAVSLESLLSDVRYGLNIPADYVEDGLRFLRALNLKEYGITGEILSIPFTASQVGEINVLKDGDLLIVRSGANAGDTGIVTARFAGSSFGSYVIRMRVSGVDPYYLYVFLKSYYGRNQTVRFRSGSAQPNISIPNLKEISVLVPSPADQKNVRRIFEQAEAATVRCIELVAEAENVLLKSLGLASLDTSISLSYERDFTDFRTANRFGAEYFMPCKQRVLDALAKQPGRLLNEHYQSVRELFDATDARRGEQVRNFDLTAALEPVLDDSAETMPAAEIGSTKKKFQAGDVVISRLRSYLREIAVVRTSPAVAAVGSSEFIVLRPRENPKIKLTPETLLIYLRSLPVQTILKWSQDGSAHPRFDEDDLLAIPVPDSVVRIAPKIDALVNEALTARAEAARLLEEAKAEVERLVLKTSTS
jgi:type I restriction enzyme, S subunit